jgi:hypothetical protein
VGFYRRGQWLKMKSDQWASYHGGDGLFPMAAGRRAHAALQRERASNKNRLK